MTYLVFVFAMVLDPAMGQVSAGFGSSTSQPKRAEDYVDPKAEAQRKLREAREIIRQVDEMRNEDPAIADERRRKKREARVLEINQKYDLKNRAAKQHPFASGKSGAASPYDFERQIVTSLRVEDFGKASSILATALGHYPEQVGFHMIRDSLPVIKQGKRKEERALRLAELEADLTFLRLEIRKLGGS